VTKVLLSIKPEFANKIFNGTKKFEFRKTLFKRSDISSILVYASSPVQRIIGEFTIDAIISGTLPAVWEITENSAGISKRFFLSYFSNKTIAYAIKIGKTTKFKRPKTLIQYNIKNAPQSFLYIED